MSADPLSDVLSLLTPRTYVAGGFDLGGEWAVHFRAHEGVKYFAVTSGRGWLAVDGEAGAILLEAGDCVLLPNGRRFVLAKDLAFERTPIEEIPEAEWRNGIATLHGGGDTTVLGGHFAFSGTHTRMLLGAMPPVLRLRDEDDKAGLRWALERMRQELGEARPGGLVAVQDLAHFLLVQALRLYLSLGVGRTPGWLFALADPKIVAAVAAMHTRPNEPWTVSKLAGVAGMSRSKFALRFRTITGTAPLAYLMRWRMMIACERLADRRETISAVALTLGYSSEAAFSTAFKRVMGRSPRRYVATCPRP